MHRRLPAPRRELRPRERPRLSLPAYLPVRTFPVGSRTGSSWSSLTAEPVRCWPTTRRGVHPLPRRGVGPPRPRRARRLRAALPRGLPVGALLADDPAQAAGVPRGVRRLRPRAGRRVRRGRRRAAARRRRDRPAPRQDRGRDRQRPCDRGAARDRRAAARALLGHAPAARPGARARRRLAGVDPRVGRAGQAPARRGLQVRRPDDRLRRHASMRRRERPSRRLLGARRRRARAASMLDDRVRAVLRRLEEETEREEGKALPLEERSLQMPADERGVPVRALLGPAGLRGARDRRLARLLDDLARRRGAPARRPRHLARGEPGQARGLGPQHRRRRPRGWIEVIPGDAFERLERLDGPYDVVFLDAWKDDYEALSSCARAARAGARRRRRQRRLPRRARRLLGRPPGRSGPRQRHRSDRQRVGSDLRLDRRATIGLTAERRWSGRWRFPVRAVEVLARRGVSPGPEGESSSQRGGYRAIAARRRRVVESAGSAPTKSKLVTETRPPEPGGLIFFRRGPGRAGCG